MRRSAAAPCAAGGSCAPGPSAPGADGARGVATWRGDVTGGRRNAGLAGHVESPVASRYGEWRLGAVCDGVSSRMRAAAGSARPDATPVRHNRHCSPLLGSCPPACLRYMGSARANRSGRSPDSEWKEFDASRPSRAASGRARLDAFERETLRGWLRLECSPFEDSAADLY